MAEVADPPHFGFGRPSSAAASAIPNCVGTKNRFVVTWLSNQNCHGGVLGKLPATFLAALAGVLDDPQAVSRAEAAAVALNSPVPVSSLRRDGPSFMFRVSIASSTFGSTFLIAILQKSYVVQGSAPRGAYVPGLTWRAAPASSPWGQHRKRWPCAFGAPRLWRWTPICGLPTEMAGMMKAAGCGTGQAP